MMAALFKFDFKAKYFNSEKLLKLDLFSQIIVAV